MDEKNGYSNHGSEEISSNSVAQTEQDSPAINENNAEINLSFEDLLRYPDAENDEPELPQAPEKTVSAPPKKKRGKKRSYKGLIWLIVIVLISLGLAYGVLRVAFDFLGFGFDLKHGIGRSGVVTVEIEQGTSTAQIAEILTENNIINCPHIFRLYSKAKHYDARYRYGVYRFERGIGYNEIANILCTTGMKATDVEIQIPAYKVSSESGHNVKSSIVEIAELMEKNHVCYASDFRALASYEFDKAIQNLNATYQAKFNYNDFDYDFLDDIDTTRITRRLEGYLFPETYHFRCHEESEYDTMPNSVFFAYEAIDQMLGMFQKRVGNALEKQSKASGYTVPELVTIASVIQQEAGIADQKDAARVAQLFFNRLNGVNWDGPKRLQSDPTVTYAKLINDVRYDTYEVEGLPPGPILTPGETALLAVANPDTDSKATYFVTDKNGTFYFNETYSGHQQTIASLKSKGLWLYTTF